MEKNLAQSFTDSLTEETASEGWQKAETGEGGLCLVK